MSEISLPSICSQQSDDWLLWSNKLSWETKEPFVTLCFQYTILNWIPLLYLWITSAIYIIILRKRKNLCYKRRGKFNLFKSILISILFFVHVMDLCMSISEKVSNRDIPPVAFIQPILSAISSILLIYVNQLTFIKGVHSSGTVLCYWFIQFIASLIIMYSRLQRMDMFDPDIFRTVTSIFIFIILLILFLSNCFSDSAVFENEKGSTDYFDENRPLLNPEHKDSQITSQPRPSPENRASFLAKVTYTWLTGLIILGYKRTLTSEDLFALRRDDTCDVVVSKMEKEWDKQILKSERKNLKQKLPLTKDKYSSNYQMLRTNEEEDEALFFSDATEPKTHKKKIKPSFLIALFNAVGSQFIIAGFFKFLADLISFIQPQLLGLLISYIENPNEHMWHGFFFGVCLFVTAMFRTIVFQQYYHGCYESGMRARTAIIGVIYRKSLRLSPASRKDTTVGEIVNLMSVDAQKIQDVTGFLHFIWSAPLTIILAIYFLWQELGAAVLAGLGLMICLLPINAFVGSKVKKLQGQQMRMKDNRIKLMSEILSGMKILKLYAWENSFEDKIKDIREKECRILRSATYLNAFSAVTWFCAPFLVALCSFAAYISFDSKNVLTSNKAFVSLSLFNILNFPMSMLPGTIVYGVQAYVSIIRLNKFMVDEELDPDNIDVSPPNEKPIKIVDGNFSWGKNDAPILTNLNIEIPDGGLVAVVGTVGSGKSSLINAILGEMHKISGTVLRRGSIAYVPQQAWCQNASLQDNILFGKYMAAHKYNRVLEACALLEDLKVLPAGDQTEVGEKGINLSGGQKQRIGLARAVYQDCSIYLFDDPLSAVDSHVGKHIFNEVIGPNSVLANKTRVLVTHGLTYLPKVDKIFVMKEGQISESGTFKELLNNNGPFADFIRTYLEQEEEERVAEDSEEEDRELKEELKRQILKKSTEIASDNEISQFEYSRKISTDSHRRHRRKSSVRLSKSKSTLAEEAEAEKRKNKRKKLIQDEIAEIGGVGFGVFLQYLKSATYLLSLIVIISYALFMASSVGANLYLSYWSETSVINGTQDAATRNTFLAIYGMLGGVQTLFVLIENFGLAYGTYLASKSLHHILLQSILRAPNSFFDTTPIGRILNRIGKDIDTVDVNIPTAIRIWLMTAAGVIGAVLAISIASPYFLLALIPLSVMYYFSQRFYICKSRQLKRIDSIKRSPIYSHFQETIVGATSIRAYKVSDVFIRKCDLMTDENQMAWYPNLVSYRWLQFNLEFIGNIIILLTAILSVVTKDSIGAGLAGLSISYALQVTGSLTFMVRMTCDLESYTVAIERIKEYADLEPEAPWDIAETRPESKWPLDGKVEFYNYSLRYRADLDLVLKNLNLIVNAGEKIGIVGRTGAGKSSLALALFRLIEPAEGTILIDNIDIKTLGLHNLRSKITIIPQDPVLFSGTLRMNLDPFDHYSDGELWSTLELAHLKSFVTKIPEGLQFIVSESGENLSVGQRQLVCLARALLKKTKILVLDEATAAVDLETDELIQSSIRRQFKQCTVLTIAHRLNTIMDYDRIMVLDQGRIKELDSPVNLLANEKTIFYGMAKDAGLV